MATVKKEPAGWEALADFVPTKMNRGIHLDIVGLEGKGKSSLALTVARCGQVGYIDIDQSIDRARRPDTKNVKARIKLLPVRYSAGLSEDTTRSTCREAWTAMETGVNAAVASWADAVIVDTGTEAWELKRLAAFGTVTPQGRTDVLYGKVNAQFRQFLRNVNRIGRKHLVTIHQYKDEYANKMINGRLESTKTGKFVRAGFKEIGFMADIVVACLRDEDGEFKARVEICKFNPGMEQMELEGDDLDFGHIVALATSTEPEDWYK